MKTRTGFVSNSSSSSFILSVSKGVEKPTLTFTETIVLEEMQDDWETVDYERPRTIDELIEYAHEAYWVTEDGCFDYDGEAETFDEYLNILLSGRDILFITTGNSGHNYDVLKDVRSYKDNEDITFVSGGY